jgi:hypothetical protein
MIAAVFYAIFAVWVLCILYVFTTLAWVLISPWDNAGLETGYTSPPCFRRKRTGGWWPDPVVEPTEQLYRQYKMEQRERQRIEPKLPWPAPPSAPKQIVVPKASPPMLDLDP